MKLKWKNVLTKCTVLLVDFSHNSFFCQDKTSSLFHELSNSLSLMHGTIPILSRVSLGTLLFLLAEISE